MCTCETIFFTQKNEPKFSDLGSAVKINEYDPSKTWKSVYVQIKSVSTELNVDTDNYFLYCECILHYSQIIQHHQYVIGAYSELVTAYSEEYDVLKACKESEFVECNIPGYHTEWICYGYFEFNKPAYIKPHQKVIVKKKVGKGPS